ncbi:uncharacterized protein AB675_479 [Cyphellophora attinorum]|uniref:Transporter n=1 Tax=Cyphellophora attinorum TaxID=1664694 RepID=A0A0N1P4B6_9EURO|nr:uncharacterized protein AB675_479 [Phialophora attinorum]KPI45407.1 hypothetical protein AB675_479 [Phialophora attinorum]
MADNTWPHPFASSNEAVVPAMPTSSSRYPPTEASKYSQEADEDRITPVPPVEQNKDNTATREEEQYKTSEEERKDAATNIVPFATDLERNVESGVYVLDEAAYRLKHGLHPEVVVKKTKDGKKVLIPQPTDSRDDPLNWPRTQKMAILVMLVVNAFTADYAAATGTSAIVAQAEEWQISPDKVNHATAGNTFMLGVGGLVAVWLSAGLVAAAAKSFESYMAARIINGFFCVAATAGGLMWINDVWFFHEHPRKINIWSTAIILSPFLGPQFMAAILSVTGWRVGMWLCFGIIMLGVVTTVAVGEETFYPRHLHADNAPQRKSRLMRLIGVEQCRDHWTTNTFLESGTRLVKTISRLPVLLVCIFYLFDFAWTIANNTTISALIIPTYNFNYRALAAIYAAPVVGALLGLAAGHFLFDLLGAHQARHYNGKTEPEDRLLILCFITPFKVLGFVLIGSTLEDHESYWILAVGWTLHTCTTVITTTAVGAYLIDAYPEASGECAAWLNFARTLGGFIVGYFQLNWVNAQGSEGVFLIEASITAAAFVLAIGLGLRGKKWRRGGTLAFKTC